MSPYPNRVIVYGAIFPRTVFAFLVSIVRLDLAGRDLLVVVNGELRLLPSSRVFLLSLFFLATNSGFLVRLPLKIACNILASRLPSFTFLMFL